METNTIDKPVVKTKEVLMPELNFSDPNVPVVAHEAKPQIAKQADELLVTLLAIEPQDLAAQQKYARAVQTIGEPIQAEIAKQSQMLKAPMTALIKDAEDGGKVANGLLNLQEQVSGINPNRVDFTMGTIRRLLAKIPGFGTPLSRWFAKYQAVDSLINDIIASLKDGRGQLERDNETLRDDQIRMRELTFKLEDYIALAQLLDQKLAVKVTELDSIDERRKFIEEELLFPIKQRVIDLQQQLAVNQQGVLASEVIIRNNRELIIGVNRALNVTVTALNTAATLQIALQHQKKVLEGVEAVTQTTNDLIAGTAEQLKTQGAAIQKQASQATLDIETLKKAFSDVQAALDDISQFRRDALPQMAQSIVEMDGITGQMEQTIQKLEKGTSAADVLILEVADA
ncbi:MAG: toxic anion resistance protein [Pseudomonadota bacterium]|nr:toxic anion resistance protein [Pseudomonadota bacterium]MEC8525433.1 toxic anion resistance protein [Pseudomonadota bacterium]